MGTAANARCCYWIASSVCMFGLGAFIYLPWPALRICVKMLDNSSRFRLPRMCVPKRALQNFNARLSLEIFNNSMHRFSYGACPTTSRTKSRTNFVCFVWICLWNEREREKQKCELEFDLYRSGKGDSTGGCVHLHQSEPIT